MNYTFNVIYKLTSSADTLTFFMNLTFTPWSGLLGEESFVMWSPKLDKCVSIFEDAGNTIALMVECDEKGMSEIRLADIWCLRKYK